MCIANPAADLHPPPGLHAAPVEPSTDVDERRDPVSVAEDEIVGALQHQAQPGRVHRRGREGSGRVGVDRQEQPIGLDRHRQPMILGGREDLRQAADGRHPQGDSGLHRPVVVHGTRQRSGSDAHRPPQRQAVVHAQTQIGMKTGQDRGHLRRDVVDRDRAATLAVGQRDAEEHLACRQIRTEGGGPDTAAQYAGIFTFNVESGERAPAPEAPPRCVLLFSGRDIEGIPGRNDANRGARTPPARRRVVRSHFHRPAVPRAPHPLVEYIHDLSRRRTAEVPDPVRRHAIHRLEGAVLVVPDGAGTLMVGQRRIARIAQPDREDPRSSP